jgi:hypothetical protein
MNPATVQRDCTDGSWTKCATRMALSCAVSPEWTAAWGAQTSTFLEKSTNAICKNSYASRASICDLTWPQNSGIARARAEQSLSSQTADDPK